MKTKSRRDHRRLRLRILSYGNVYYTDRVAKLEKILTKKPRVLQIDLVGVGEIPADTALRIRALLIERSPETRVVTNAQSSLQNSSVLVWLLGDTRVIRSDARLCFRSVDPSQTAEVTLDEPWKEDDSEYCEFRCEANPEEGDYARVLEAINDYLPIREMADRLIGVPVLRQFGLVDNAQVDEFLAKAFAKPRKPLSDGGGKQKQRRPQDDSQPVRPARTDQ